jgi:hypothetical protein
MVKSNFFDSYLLWGTKKMLVTAVRIKAINVAKAIGTMSLYKLTPDTFKIVISLSPDSLPNPIKIDIRSDMGMVRIRNDGVNKRKSFEMSMKLTPLLTIKSINWRIFPIRRTKVKTKMIRKNGYEISFRM